MKHDPFERLRELFPKTVREPANPEHARRRLFAVMFSVIVAFVLWFTVSMRDTYTITVESPLNVVTLPAGQALAVPPLATVRVQLQGVGWDLLQLSRRPPGIDVFADGPKVDLRGAAAEGANLPAGVLIQSVQPQQIELVLDDRIRRRLPISLIGEINIEPTFGMLGSAVLQPDSVVVTGARSLLEGFDSWPSTPLDLNGLRRSTTSTLALSDTLSGLVTLSVDRTEVSVDVAQMTEGSRQMLVRTENVPPSVSDVRLIPSSIRVTYQVPAAGDDYDLAETAEDFYAYVDYADIASDSTEGTVPVALHLPEGLLIQDVRLDQTRVEYYTVRE